MRTILALCTVALLAACGGGNHGGNPPAPDWQPSLDPAAWNIQHSPGQPSHPGPGWVVDFPVNTHTATNPCSNDQASDCPAVHYITTAALGGLASAKALTISGTISTSGGATLLGYTEPSNTCAAPAVAHLFLQHTGDQYLSTDTYRFWSVPTVKLQDGRFTLTVSLTDLTQWGSVFGHPASQVPGGFADTLGNLQDLGLTLGSGCFAGHGSYVDKGAATMTVTSYSVGW